MLNVIVLNVIVLNVTVLNVIVLNVVVLNVIVLNVIVLDVIVLNVKAAKDLGAKIRSFSSSEHIFFNLSQTRLRHLGDHSRSFWIINNIQILWWPPYLGGKVRLNK